MQSEAEWAEDVKRLLRAEMARRGITYEELAERLAAVGRAKYGGQFEKQRGARSVLRSVPCPMPQSNRRPSAAA